jgi:L-amino acid N-acyltransferase YncA
VIIRPATLPDSPAIAEIWNYHIRTGTITFNPVEKTTDEVAAMIVTRPAFFVADVAGLITGFATYDQFRGGAGYARTMEHTVQLSPGQNGRGFGRALMQAVEDHARAAGAHSIFAGVSAENHEGRAFHARLGYRETAILPEVGWKFGRWLDLVLMQKFLS